MIKVSVGISTLLVLGVSAVADPGTVTLDRQDAQSRVGAELTYQLADVGNTKFRSGRLDIHGQYVAESGYGFYAAMPAAYVSIDYDTIDDDSWSAIGNVDVGAIFVPRLCNPHISLPVHVGITLPFATDDLEDAGANSHASNTRITDFALAIPEGFVVRAGVSPTVRYGRFYAKGDGGIDVTLSNDGFFDVDPFLKLNAAAGIDLGRVSFAAELATLFFTDSDVDDQIVSTAAVGARAVVGRFRPYGGVVFPIDADYIDAGFTAGIEGVIQ